VSLLRLRCSAFEQADDGGVSVLARQLGGGYIKSVGQIWIGGVGEEVLDDLYAAPARGVGEGGVAFMVLRVHVSTAFDQFLDGGEVVVVGGDDERGVAAIISLIYRCAGFKQFTDDREIVWQGNGE
jgi:hypothetical protein